MLSKLGCITFYNERRPRTAIGRQLTAVVYIDRIETHQQVQEPA